MNKGFATGLKKIFTGRTAAFWFYAYCLTLLALVVGTGLPIQTHYGHSDFVVLDGAWRIANGFVPHRDFYTPLGPLLYYLFAFAFLFTGANAHALLAGHMIAAGGIFAIFYLLARDRIPRPLFYIYGACVLTISLSTRVIFLPHDWVSYTMIYNRYGYALLGCLLPAVYLPRLSTKPSTNLFEGFVVGVLMGLLLFLKINYFAGAGLFLLLGLSLRRNSLKWWIYSFYGFAAVVFFMMALMKGSIPYMFADLLIAQASRLSGNLFLQLWEAFFGSWFLLLMLIVTVAFLRRSSGDRPPLIRDCLLILMVACAATIIRFTNLQGGSFFENPLMAFACLIALAPYSNRLMAIRQPSLVQILPWAACLVATLVTVLPDLIMIVETPLVKYFHKVDPAESFSSPRLAGLIIPGYGGKMQLSSTFVEKVNDGLELVAALPPELKGIEVLDFTNPISFGSGRKPSDGGAVWWHTNTTFGPQAAPAVENIFKGCDIIMYPRSSAEPTATDLLVELYGKYIDENYSKAAESPCWIVFVRRK